MPYIFVFSKFPSHKAPETGKKFLEQLKKYPSDDSLGITVVNAAVKARTDGVQVVSVSTVIKGKLEDSLNRTNEILSMYNEIEGFEYTIEVWSEPGEALATVGLKMPE